MAQIVDAIFEHGIFRPLDARDLRLDEGQQVQLVVYVLPSAPDVLALATQVYDGLSPAEIDEVEQLVLDRRDFFPVEAGIQSYPRSWS